MSKMQSHDHYQNQKGWKMPEQKPSLSTSKKIGITPPQHSTKGSKKTETAVSPDTDTSNGGM